MALAGLLLAAPAGAMTFTFDDLGPSHGRVLMDDTYESSGLVVSAVNIGGGPNLAVLFDSERTGTADPDLEIPGRGHILIIQENSTGCGDGVCDDPDDEGSRPAGSIFLDFVGGAIRSFATDLIDIENSMDEPGSFVFYTGTPGNYVQVGSVSFESLILPGDFGNRSENTIGPIVPETFGESGFDRVEVRMGGSGGIDNVMVDFQVIPEPASLSLLAIGLLGLTWTGRGRRRR